MEKMKMPFLGAAVFIMVMGMASSVHGDAPSPPPHHVAPPNPSLPRPRHPPLLLAGRKMLEQSHPDRLSLSLDDLSEFKPPSTNPPPPPPRRRAMIAGISMGFFIVDAACQLFSILSFGFAVARDCLLSTNKNTRGSFIAIQFFFDILTGCMATIIIVSADFTHPYSINAKTDVVWRIILIMAAAFTYYWRMRMLETASYRALVSKNAMLAVRQVDLAAEQLAGGAKSNALGLFSSEFLRRHGKHMLCTATTTTWFLLDIAFCSQHLFQKDIFSAIGWIPAVGTMNALEELFRISRAHTLIALCGTLPGFWFTVFLIDRIGCWASFFFMFAFAISDNNWSTQKENGIDRRLRLRLLPLPKRTAFVAPWKIFPARLRKLLCPARTV